MDLIDWICAAVILSWYFLPAIVASGRHKNVVAIFALNLLLGWTVLGWIVALVCAYRPRKTKNNMNILARIELVSGDIVETIGSAFQQRVNGNIEIYLPGHDELEISEIKEIKLRTPIKQ